MTDADAIVADRLEELGFTYLAKCVRGEERPPVELLGILQHGPSNYTIKYVDPRLTELRMRLATAYFNSVIVPLVSGKDRDESIQPRSSIELEGKR